MDNKKRRDSGMAYLVDKEVLAELLRCRRLLQQLNQADWADHEALTRLTEKLLGKSANGAIITPPFFCDYGTHITIGRNSFVKFNCTMLDVAPITIGNNCFLAPNVQLLTAGHPIHNEARTAGIGYGKPITLGDRVWLGAGTVVCPGVRIGDNTVVGAGSVVTRDLPADVVAAGNPCRVLRSITEADRDLLFKKEPIDAEALAWLESRRGRF